MPPSKISTIFLTNSLRLTSNIHRIVIHHLSTYISQTPIINIIIYLAKKKKRPTHKNKHSSRVRKISKKLNVAPALFPKDEVNPSSYKQSFYEKSIESNEVPIECQNRRSKWNDSKKRKIWERSCYQNYSTILLGDSQAASFANTKTVLNGTQITSYSGMFI